MKNDAKCLTVRLIFWMLFHFQLYLIHSTNTERLSPIIIWWSDNIFPHINDESLTTVNCGNVVCRSTTSRKFLDDNNTRSIIFYGSSLQYDDLPLPRGIYHEWALFHEESPMNNYALSHQELIELFNHTATFRRESDYPISTQNIYSLSYLRNRRPRPLSIKNKERKEKGLASVLYVQSHSSVPSDRDKYVSEMMKYIKIDSYGKCLHNKDLPEQWIDAVDNFEEEDYLDFISLYKFHLAFENAICNDYMTEKLMRPLHLGSIPIYLGSPVAMDWMPNNKSVIMVNDFKSPKDLVDFIEYLDRNDTAYEEYMQHKKKGGVTNQFLVNNIKLRDWGTHDHKYWQYNQEGKQNYFSGFECYVCRSINEHINADVTQQDSTMSPKMADNSVLGCPEPQPLFSVNDISENTNGPHPIQEGYQWVTYFNIETPLQIETKLGQYSPSELYRLLGTSGFTYNRESFSSWLTRRCGPEKLSGKFDWKKRYQNERIKALAVSRMVNMKESNSSKFWDYYNQISMETNIKEEL